MTILDRYVAREFLRLFTLFVTSVPLMLTIFDITDQLDRHLDRGIPIDQIALSYAYQLPLFILYAFPIAGLIATIFTVNSMTRHSEVAAAKAGGISFYRLMAPIGAIAVMLTGGALALSEIVPVTNGRRAEALGERNSIRSARSDFVYSTSQGHVFSIRRLDVNGGRISGITMERPGQEGVLPSIHLTARDAEYSAEGGWKLQDGYLRILDGPDRERAIQFGQLQPIRFTEAPEDLLAEPPDPDEMRYAELGRFIETRQRSGGQPLKLIVERAQKIALPVATLIIILFAAPMAMSSPRGGPAYGVGISLGITIFYLMLFRIFGAAGATGAIQPMVAAWLPNVAFAGAAVFMLWRVRT